MQPNNRQPSSHSFNDYIISPSNPGYKLLSSQDRSVSSHSIYYQQNSVARKKLTVVSRDNSRPDLRGDYLMMDNGAGLVVSARGSGENGTYSPIRNNDSSNTFSQRHSQATESLTNSKVHKSKLKRPISPSPAPMTPTKVLKLKKSMLSENRQQLISQMSQQRSANNSISRRKFQSQVTSPIKIPIEGHRRLASTTSDAQVVYRTQNSQFQSIQSVRRQLSSLLNLKIQEFQSKLKQQDETIRFLENRLNENQRQLREKDMMIERLSSRQRRQTQFLIAQESNKQKNVTCTNQNVDETYISKRVKDIQAIYRFIFTQQNKLEKTQQSVNKKISLIESQLIKLNFSKLTQLKSSLGKFLNLKSAHLSTLSESISHLDNKLIGRTQAIKQTLCELKQKIKQAEDSWTHKDTKETKESTTIGTHKEDPEQYVPNNKNSAVRRVQNKLREITSFQDIKDSPYKGLQGSLQFSLTSYDQETLRSNYHQKKPVRNVYYEQNPNEMEDVSIGLYGDGQRDDCSRLTDDFYYPGSTSNSSKMASRNLSPINPKKQTNEYFANLKQSSQQQRVQFTKKQSPLSTKSPRNPLKSVSLQQSPASQNIIRISNQQINKKMYSIQQLIQNKKTTSCESIEKGQLRCYVDKTGYLKYTDSKTFVFDRKGNLIPCTEGEFWFLVTKGLIYGKRDEEESRTMSFIQVDQ